MDNTSLLITAMAEECRGMILACENPDSDLPESLQLDHLQRMCERIERHAEDWPATKLHRWIGFVQCAMIANRMLDLNGAKAMFDKAKNAHGGTSEDLLDHLDPKCSFELDIGGEG
jgi:hypothetical protein